MAPAFAQSRFVAVVGGTSLRCTRIKSIALGLLLEQGHVEGQPLLHSVFRGQRTLDVWLVNATASLARHFRFSFESFAPLPLDLNMEIDVHGDPPAMDRFLLRNVLILIAEDVALD